MPTVENKTDPKKLRTIWVLARERKMDNDMLHDFTEVNFGIASLKNLSDKKANQIIARLLNMKINKDKVEKRASFVCTVKQEAMITGMEKDLLNAGFFKTGRADEFREHEMRRIAGEAYRTKWIHTPKKDASKYIELLKSITDRLKRRSQSKG